MNARDWERKALEAAEVVDLALPSGMVIRARRPGPVQLAAWGLLPFGLAAAAAGVDAAEKARSVDVEKTFAQMRDLLVYCCVAPRVSLEPAGEEEIHPRAIPERDWTFIVRWALRAEETAALRSFRRERADGGDCGDSEGIRAAAEHARGAVGPGYGSEL